VEDKKSAIAHLVNELQAASHFYYIRISYYLISTSIGRIVEEKDSAIARLVNELQAMTQQLEAERRAVVAATEAAEARVIDDAAVFNKAHADATGELQARVLAMADEVTRAQRERKEVEKERDVL
jgi:hypothetical protein